MHIEIHDGIITRTLASSRVRVTIDGADLTVPDGCVVVPGFVDTHCHLMGLGQMAERVQLGGLNTIADCLSRVALRALSTPPGEWILGFGWNETEWLDRSQPTSAALDGATLEHPVALYRVDTHAVWLNSVALATAGISARHIDGGEIVVDRSGAPTGLLIDTAVHLIDHVLPKPRAEKMHRWLSVAVDRCLAYGLTEVHDMNVALDALHVIASAADAGELRLRSSVYLEGMNDGWRAFGPPRSLAPMLDVVGVKYFSDGALGSRGAWLLEPYADDATRGIQMIAEDELVARALAAAEVGHAIATHAIGDAAVRMTLDAYARMRSEGSRMLLRVEHAQNVQPVDLPRFAALDVVAAVQPTHCTSDAAMAEARLGALRCRNAYPWRSLLDSGARVIAGSDFPIESPDPLAGLRAFVHREPKPGAGAWHAEQALDVDAALKAFTEWAPAGRPGPVRRGTLQPGNDADVVVLTGDPLDTDNAVLYTIIGGRVEYEGA